MVQGTTEDRFGVLVSALVAIIVTINGLIGLLQPQVFESDMASDGWGSETLFPVAMLSFVSGLIYAIPRTALLGAIMITGFVGGALATHLRVTQAVILPEIINVTLGICAWGGLWLRDPRLRALLPLR